jgi:hypothetical protein
MESYTKPQILENSRHLPSENGEVKQYPTQMTVHGLRHLLLSGRHCTTPTISDTQQPIVGCRYTTLCGKLTTYLRYQCIDQFVENKTNERGGS